MQKKAVMEEINNKKTVMCIKQTAKWQKSPLSVITLNGNGLNSLVKTQILTGQTKYIIQLYAVHRSVT